MHVGDIMSTAEGVKYRGGTQITKNFFLRVRLLVKFLNIGSNRS